MSFGLAAGPEDLQAREVMTPTERMPADLAFGQAVMDNVDARTAVLWSEENLERAGGGRKIAGATPAPCNHQPARAIDLDVPSLDATVSEVEREFSARSRIQHCAVAHPSDDRFGLGEIVEDQDRLCGDEDRVAIGLTGHGAIPPLSSTA